MGQMLSAGVVRTYVFGDYRRTSADDACQVPELPAIVCASMPDSPHRYYGTSFRLHR